MARGKQTCKILKEIRRQIARANNIELITTECRYKGDCSGTCPKCEAEVRYLEQQLRSRQLMGKAVALAGLSAGLLALSCSASTPDSTFVDPTKELDYTKMVVVGEVEDNDTSATQRNRPLSTNEVDVVPEFPGGDEAMYQFMGENIKMPSTCYGNSGKMYVKFVIDKTGKVCNLKIIRSELNHLLNKEVLRVIGLFPQFKPGEKDGEAVDVVYVLPVTFRMQR